MAKTDIITWDTTDANNTDISGIPVTNATLIAQLDDIVRGQMGATARLTNTETIASSSTTNIAALAGQYVNVTGTTTITALGTVRTGIIKFVKFAAALTLTHNATSLILPTSANITTAAGDMAVLVSEGSGNWRCLAYSRATGAAILANYAGKNDSQRNRIVNGDMRISQENGTTSGTTTGFYPVDQWAQFRVTSAGTLTVAQVASVTPAGSPNRLRATVTVADATLAAGEYWTISQNLEGSNVADFQYGGASAKAAVLRFGFKGPAGTYAVALHNSAANRSYVALFTITAPQANTDTVQEIAITGDATGTWLTADGVIGITLDIVLAAGTTFQGAVGWQAGLIYGTSAVSNGMATGGSVFELFDVGFRLDPDATGVYGTYRVAEVDPVYRSERYFYAIISGSNALPGMAQITATSTLVWNIPTPELAKSPTLSLFQNVSHSAANGSFVVATTASISSSSTKATNLSVTSSNVGFTPGFATLLAGNNANSRVNLSARLS